MIGEQQSISRHRDRSATLSVIIDTLAYHAGILYNVGLHDIRQHYAAHRERTRDIVQGVRPDLTLPVDAAAGGPRTSCRSPIAGSGRR